jgi:beta-glucosidase
LTIGIDALKFYNDKQQTWTAEPGAFEALIGNASDNITSRVKFTLSGL